MSFSCISSTQLQLTFTLLLCAWSLCIDASVHLYSAEKFVNKGNAFVVHGGSEGIRSSIASRNDGDADSASNAESYIRYVFPHPSIWLCMDFYVLLSSLGIVFIFCRFYFIECWK